MKIDKWTAGIVLCFILLITIAGKYDLDRMKKDKELKECKNELEYVKYMNEVLTNTSIVYFKYFDKRCKEKFGNKSVYGYIDKNFNIHCLTNYTYQANKTFGGE
ncbi:MAG: hypothetical protein ACTSX6_03290 [Candidatus Heimdallarchaeaceae archaeon]